MEINQNLIDKYNKSTPRYTSYPPANYFDNNFSEDNYISLIEQSDTIKPSNLSFYVHIPFCQQICTYCGCHSLAGSSQDRVTPYIDAVKKEIIAITKRISKHRKIAQIHYGGGTPNVIDIRYLKEINELFLSLFQTIEKPEIAIECHPGLLNEADIDLLIDAKFNRFSLGVQDFNDEVLRNVNRKPSILPINQLVSKIRSHKQVSGVNMDFIYGLPGQTKKNFTETIEKAISIKPDRLVTFSYAHVPWLKKYQEKLAKIGLPNATEKTKMFLSAYNTLQKNGYVPIGFDHYALPNDELTTALENNLLHRNFQGYSTLRTTGQVYSFGVSAISQLSNGYAQNTKDLKKYIELINNNKFTTEKGLVLSNNERLIGAVISKLMCNQYINWQQLAMQLNVDKQYLMQTIEYNREKLQPFEADGFIKINNDELRITEIGNYFIRNIVAVFDPLFASTENVYSKSI